MSIRRAQDERLEGTPDGLGAITEIMDFPDAPTAITATNVGTSRAYNNGAATVAITPAVTGGTPATYNVISTPGSFTANGASPVTVTGLQSQTSYTFQATGVTSTSVVGIQSAASTSITATTVPQAPTIGTATDAVTGGGVSVPFTAGATGGSAVSTYTATSSPGSLTGTSATSPITVSGLTVGTAYTFTVTATNANGTSTASSASNSVTPTNPPIIVVTAGTDLSNYSFHQDVYRNWSKIENAANRSAAYPSGSGRLHITYGVNKWVIIQENSNNNFAYSADGTTWTKATLPVTAYWVSLAYSPGISLFVAVANDGTGVYSSNGTTWTSYFTVAPNAYQGLGKGSDKMVALGSSIARYTTNGFTWSNGSGIPSTTGRWTPVYGTPGGTGRYVAIERSGSATPGRGYSSANGISWSAMTLPGSIRWGGVTYDGTAGKFLIFIGQGEGSDYAAYSSNGTTWTISTTGTGDNSTGNSGVCWLAAGYGTTWGVNNQNGARAFSYDGGVNFPGSNSAPYGYWGGYEAAWNIDGGYG